MERRPLMMLKDHLLDDFSSCSSNGFKSFPRRQCCTTVRLFLDKKDLKSAKRPSNKTKSGDHNRSKPSALRRTSEAVINAVKLLPFPSSNSVKPPSSSGKKASNLLPRSISRKLFKGSFWRKTEKKDGRGIGRLRLFRDFVAERHKPSDETAVIKDYHCSNSTAAAVISAKITPRISTSSSSNSNSNSDSWTEAESDSSTNAEIFTCGSVNGAVEGKKELISCSSSSEEVNKEVSERVGVSGGQDDYITHRAEQDNLTKEWRHEEKQQFSPVSVLDCPFKDEEEEDEDEEGREISSPSQRRLVRLEGNIKKPMQKMGLAHLEPVDLEKRIALAESGDNEWLVVSPKQQFPMSIHDKNDDEHMSEGRKHVRTEDKAGDLLKLVKATNAPSNRLTSNADSLLLDFFEEKIEENRASGKKMAIGQEGFDQELEAAKDWINGQPREMFLGWEVEDMRHVYVAGMEKNGDWRNLDEAKQEVALEMELEIFSSLISEALLDIVV